MALLTPYEILQDCIRQSHARQTGVNAEGQPQFQGVCPAHVDGEHGEPSLSLSWSPKKESPLLCCQAGCLTAQVAYGFGYSMAELFPHRMKHAANGHAGGGGRKSKGRRYNDAEAEAIYSYQNEDRQEVYQILRFPKGHEHHGQFPIRHRNKAGDEWIWNGQGVKRIIYKLPDVLASTGPVFICEGEKDVESVWAAGLPATCNPGGASASPTQSKWKESFSEPLAGRECIILPDNDDAGRIHAMHVAKSLAKHAASVKVLELPGLAEKGDVTDWMSAGGTADELLKLAAAASPFNVEEAAAKHLVVCNYEETGDGKAPLTMRQIVERIDSVTEGWPRRVGNALFVPRSDESSGINWLERSTALFGWIASQQNNYTPDFAPGAAMIPKVEVYEYLRMHVRRYEHVELHPHEPEIPGHYYACQRPPEATEDRLSQLIDMFRPKTPADRQLILAMFLTIFWGGQGGKRPAFLITGEGRGSGKSVLPYTASRLCGGTVDISPGDEADKIKARLLSPEGMSKRVAIIDNVKSHRFSWPDFEALITAPVISGRRDYMGEQTRPNNLTWIITLNGPSLSTDITHRAIMVHLAKPIYDPEWDRAVSEFIETHFSCIRANILGLLQASPRKPASSIRWGQWGFEVLSRCGAADGLTVDALQEAIISRQKEADVEADDGGLIEDKIREKLIEQGYQTDSERVFIPTRIIAGWINEATGERYKIAAAGRVLAQKINEGETVRLERNETHKWGRGFIWIGESAVEDSHVVLDIESRIENKPGRGF